MRLLKILAVLLACVAFLIGCQHRPTPMPPGPVLSAAPHFMVFWREAPPVVVLQVTMMGDPYGDFRDNHVLKAEDTGVAWRYNVPKWVNTDPHFDRIELLSEGQLPLVVDLSSEEPETLSIKFYRFGDTMSYYTVEPAVCTDTPDCPVL